MSRAKRVLLAVAPWLPVLVLGIPTAYFEVFRRFAFLDDEGMFLQSLRYFTDGHALYDEVFSQYGPAYHLIFGAFYKLSGIPIDHQSGRLIVVMIWVITATAIGVVVKRLTGSVLIGVTAQAVGFGSASLLSGEPMHPVGLVCLLLSGILFTLTAWERRPVPAAATLGFLIGVLMLVKINIGGLAAIAIVCAAGLTVPALRDDRRVRWAAIALLLAIGPALMAPDLTDTSVAQLVLLLWAALGAALLALTPQARSPIPGRAMILFVVVASVTAFAIVALILALGTTPWQLYDNVVTQPTNLRLVFFARHDPQLAVIYISVFAFATAYVVRRSGLAGSRPETACPGLARVAAAILIWAAIISSDPFELGKSGRVIIPLALGWIALLPAGGWRTGPSAFTRTAIVLIATLQLLHTYPVAGTQIEVVALLFVPVGGLILADGVQSLRAAGPWAVGPVSSERLLARAPALLGLLLAAFALTAVVLPLRTWGRDYRDNEPLDLPGTSGMRLKPRQTADYRRIVGYVRRDCDMLLTVPGPVSFNIWSELGTVDGFNSSDWVYFLDAREQGHTARSIPQDARLCLLVNYSSTVVWRLVSRLGPFPRRPLLALIDRTKWTELARGPSYDLVLLRRAKPGEPDFGPAMRGY